MIKKQLEGKRLQNKNLDPLDAGGLQFSRIFNDHFRARADSLPYGKLKVRLFKGRGKMPNACLSTAFLIYKK